MDSAVKERRQTAENIRPRTKTNHGGDRPTNRYAKSLNPKVTSAG